MENLRQHLDAIRDAVGPKGVAEAADEIEPFITETRGLWRGRCELVVSPASTGETARVVAICAEAGLPIVAMGILCLCWCELVMKSIYMSCKLPAPQRLCQRL